MARVAGPPETGVDPVNAGRRAGPRRDLRDGCDRRAGRGHRAAGYWWAAPRFVGRAGRAPGSLISRRDTLTCWSPWTWAYRRSAVCVLHRDIENFAEETFGLLDNI